MGEYIIGGPDQDPNLQMDPVTGKAFLATERRHEGVRGKGRLPTTLVELRQGLDNRASQSSAQHPDDRSGMMGTSGVQVRPVQRARTPDELMDMAHQMLDNQSEQHKALLGAGASTGDRNDAGGKVPDWLAQEMSRNDDR